MSVSKNQFPEVPEQEASAIKHQADFIAYVAKIVDQRIDVTGIVVSQLQSANQFNQLAGAINHLSSEIKKLRDMMEESSKVKLYVPR
jgi:hypothetical protein